MFLVISLLFYHRACCNSLLYSAPQCSTLHDWQRPYSFTKISHSWWGCVYVQHSALKKSGLLPSPLSSNLVLALPRGGLPVAKEVASELHAPLDLVTVRKVGCPGHDEFAVGALTEESVWLNEETLQQLGYTQHTPAVVSTIEKEKKEARRREHVYRASIPEYV